MSSPTERYARKTDELKQRWVDLAIRIALPITMGVSAWTFTQLWQHENRLTVLETRWDSVTEDVREIKNDVKKLLGGR